MNLLSLNNRIKRGEIGMLFLFRQIPVGFGWRWKDFLIYDSWFFRFVLGSIFIPIWLFDKIGWFLECTPLYFASCGFWVDYYIPKGRKIIQEYGNGLYSKEKCEHLLQRIDIKLYGFWFLSTIPIWFGAVFFIFPYLLSISLSPLRILGIISLILVIHEFACPSSIRRWRAALETGNVELAKIINFAGPSCAGYFRKSVLNSSKDNGIVEDLGKVILRMKEVRKMPKIFQLFKLDVEEMEKTMAKKGREGLNLAEAAKSLTRKLKDISYYNVLESSEYVNGIPKSIIVAGKISRPIKKDFYVIAKDLGLPWFTSGPFFREI